MDITTKNFIEAHPSFTTGEFADALRVEAPNIGRSTIYHLLKLLCEKGEITRTRKGYFTVSGKKDYSYDLSDTAKAISSDVQEQYPLVDFQIWELYQMNEFVNHQMAKNTIFIEVENILDESIFNRLFEAYPHVLHNPSANEYYKYAGDETIVVRRLISEAPPGCVSDARPPGSIPFRPGAPGRLQALPRAQTPAANKGGFSESSFSFAGRGKALP